MNEQNRQIEKRFTAKLLRAKEWVRVWSLGFRCKFLLGPFVNFGYRVPGKPSFYSFNDAPSFSVGTTLALDDTLVAIASYDFDGSISTSLADAQQIFASLTWLATDNISLTAYAEDGLSSGAPKLGTGLLVSWKLR